MTRIREEEDIPNLKSLAKIVAEISRRSQSVVGAPLAQTQKVVLACYSLNTSCITNFKLLASVAAEMNRRVAKLGCAKCGRIPHL